MATQVQFRRGTTSQNNAFTGAQGEFTVDTDVWTIRIHDGATPGGKVVPTLSATQTFTNKTMGSNSVWNGNAIGLNYGGTGAALSGVAGAIVYTTGSAMALSLAGTSGQVLTSGGTSGPTWVNASALSTGTATSATTAANILGGSAGYLVYQEDTDTTNFITPGTEGYILKSTGASTPPSWVTPDLTIGTTAVAVGTTETDFDGINTFYITGTTDASSDTTGVLTVAGGASVKKNFYVGGNLIVNGTTTTINSTTLTVDDKNIELGSVNAPSNSTADGGGITLLGATNKTIIWDTDNSNWTSSENWNLAANKTYKIENTKVLEPTKLFADGQTSITIGNSATTTAIGAATGTTTVKADLTVDGDVQVKGGDITTNQTTFNLLNATATTLNIGGAATTIAIGAATGTTTLGHQLKFSRANSTADATGQILLNGATGNRIDWSTAGTAAPAFTTRSVGTKLTLYPAVSGSAVDYAIGINSATLWNSIPQADDSMRFKWYGGTTEVASISGTGNMILTSTGYLKIPVGDTAARPGSPLAGMVRYNSEISSFEGYASGAWSSLGGVKSVDGLTYILAETSAGASNDELEFYTATDASNTAKRGGWNKTRLYSATPILIGTNASLSDFANAKVIASAGNTGDTHPYNAGIVGEGVASGSDTTIWGVGVYGVGASNGGTKSAGVLGDGHVSATGDTGSAVGVRGYAVDTHAGGLNVALFGEASGSGVGNYALYMETGNILSNVAQTWTLYDNQSSALTLGSTGKSDILKIITTDAAEGVTMSGTLGVTGDFKVNTDKFTVTASNGNTLVAGALTVTGDAAVNGGDITTNQTTFNLLNTTATTVNFAGDATTVNIGSTASGADVNVGADLHVTGNLYVTGTQSTGSIATISGADSAIYVNAGAVGNTKEIGLIGEYYSSGTKYTGLLKDHTDGVWKFFSNPTAGPSAGTTQSFTGATYDAVKMGELTSTTGTFSTALNSTGDFKVATNKFTVASATGNTVVAGTLGITSDLAVNTNKFTVAASTGNTLIAGTLEVTGHPKLEGVTATGATGTGALVFGTSPSLTTPTLGVASATSVNKVTITTPATGSTLTIADGKTLTVSNTLTFTGTDSSSVAFGTGGTVLYSGGALGTPSSGTLTNATGLPVGSGISGLGTGVATFLATPSSANLLAALTDETGTGVNVFGTSPTFTTSIDGGATFSAFASVTSGTIGYSGTGASSTWNISTAALTGAYTKTLNIGTGGTTGSTTTINIGSATTGQTLIRGGLAVGSTTNTTDGEIRATSTITSYYSDDRLKDRKGNIENALEKVLSLDGFHYTANETAAALGYDSSKEEVGLSAQQVQSVLPQVVVPAPIDDKYLTIQYDRVIPLLVEAIKEQQKQIEELKAKLGN